MSGEPEDRAATVRRIFGRGFVAGLQAAEKGISTMNTMHPGKYEQAERGLTSAARKVLHAVSALQSQPIGAICSELMRGGTAMDHVKVAGCLASLKDDGLVKEPAAGQFIRVMPRPKEEVLVAQIAQPIRRGESITLVGVNPTDSSLRPVAASTDTLGRLAELSQQLRAHGRLLIDFAESIDNVALDVEQRIQQAEQGADRLRQLQQLLKGITTD
jgi:hypothetical protein